MATTTAWVTGTVKEVQSGDCLLITRSANGDPVQQRLNLANLSAPRLPRRDGTTTSEEFAWESRIFLTQLAIGQKCTYRVDYKVDAIDREFGTVILHRATGEKVNVALEVAKAGWAKVRANNDAKTPDFEQVQAAAEAAEEAGRGVYNTDPEEREAARFEFDVMAGSDGHEYVLNKEKGCPVPAIVEQILTGSTYKVITLPEREVLTFVLCGAQAPAVRRNADTGGFDAEPFGLEAKALAETTLLNREVRCEVHLGEDNRIYGVLHYESSAKGKPVAASFAETLLDAALAKYADWSAKLLDAGPAAKLKAKELAAKESRAGMWKSYVPPVRATAKMGGTFTGKVIEIVSGDTAVVKDPSGKEIRFSLASIRCPRMRPSDNPTQPEPYARDARNFLRKHFIGKEVNVRLEYSRKVQSNNPSTTATPENTMTFGNMTLEGSQGPQEAAEMVVRRGFASVMNSSEGEERSSIIGQLKDAEEYAMNKRSGIHSGKDSGTVHFNDCTLPGSAARAKQYLPFFQRTRAVPGVVEHVMSGSRIKVFVPKESVAIAFSPSGVRTPARGQPARGHLPAVTAEPFGDEAFSFVRETIMQRDVTLSVESMDRAGNFLGRLYVGKVDLSLALLSAGLGQLHPSFAADRVTGAQELIAAQEAAQKAKKGMWVNYDPEDDEPVQIESTSRNRATVPATKSVTVTHVTDGKCLHIQSTDEPRLAWVTKEIAASVASSTGGLKTPPKPGMRVLAKFSVDGLWYRGFVEKVYDQATKNESCEVYFLDYGNSQRVSLNNLKTMDAGIAAVAPMAHTVCLAYVKVPGYSDEDYGYAAADELSRLVLGGIKFNCKTVTVQKVVGSHPRDAAGLAHVVLFPDGSTDLELSVNAAILETGYAKLPPVTVFKTPAGKEAVAILADFEHAARRSHRGMFRYGDPGDSDDEDYSMPNRR